MGKNDKDKKSSGTSTVAKGVTLAAMVAALGVSLGTEVKSVYAQGDDSSGVSRIRLADSKEMKLQTGNTLEVKHVVSHSGTILEIRGDQVTINEGSRVSTYTVRAMCCDSVELLKNKYRVGGSITGQLIDGKLVIEK